MSIFNCKSTFVPFRPSVLYLPTPLANFVVCMRNERRYEVSGEVERHQSDTDNKEAFLPQEEGSTPFDSPITCASHLGTDSRPFVDRSYFPFQISTSRYASAELIGAFDEMRLESEPPHQQSESVIHTIN